MVTIMKENKQVATVRILYTYAFYFGKKCTGSKMTSVVPMCVHFLSMLMRVNFINVPKIIFYHIFLFIFGSN